MNVSWVPQYNPVYFEVRLSKDSEVILAVSQLDSRYFSTLQGRYLFHLETVVKHKEGSIADHIANSGARDPHDEFSYISASIETHLRAGIYEVLVKVTAVERVPEKDALWSAKDVVKQSLHKPPKLQQTARNYDAAYGKLLDIDPKAETSIAAAPDVDTTRVYPDAKEVSRQAVCGVGLRVFSKDPDMEVELHHRKESKAQNRNATSADEMAKVCVEEEDVYKAEPAEDFYQSGS